MKLLCGHKDGGPESNVRCWGIEINGLFSILLLHFAPGSREAFHSHAFNALSWVLAGGLWEEGHMQFPRNYGQHVKAVDTDGAEYHYRYETAWRPIVTRRQTFHKVSGGVYGAWVFTLRGRWHDNWQDGQPGKTKTLTHGRKEK